MTASKLPEDDKDVIEMQVARILSMSDEEILAEVLASGIDIVGEIERINQIVEDAIERDFRRKLVGKH